MVLQYAASLMVISLDRKSTNKIPFQSQKINAMIFLLNNWTLNERQSSTPFFVVDVDTAFR